MLLLLGDRRTLEVVRYGKNTIFTQFLLQKDTRIELVTIPDLCQLLSNCLELEQQARSCYDVFIDVFSNKGTNWLLFDEILLTVGQSGQYLEYFKTTLDTVDEPAKLFSLGQKVVKKLQHLNSSFFTVIFQEGLKCFQKEEPSGEESKL